MAETSAGSFGMLPQRLDCVAALVPGIFEYETTQGIVYVAVDEGIMIKAGTEVMVSVRNAHGGTDLGKLHESIEKEFMNLDENEKKCSLREGEIGQHFNSAPGKISKRIK